MTESTRQKIIEARKFQTENQFASAPERFWKKVHKTDDVTQCWNWHSNPGTWHGRKLYPMVSYRAIKKTPLSAHRVAFNLHYGFNPKGGHICHRCGNHLCCNPHHLYHGTAKQNHLDAVEHGTFVPLKTKYGEDVHCSKLSVAKVLFVRRVWPSLIGGDKTILAELLGISTATLRRVVNGKAWSHVQPT